MTASERSVAGFSVQSALGTPATNHTNFDYFLFNEGGLAPQNVVVPLDQEVGGGAMLRSLIKAGVVSSGAFSFVPRPHTIGHLLLGALGSASVPAQIGLTPAYTHQFVMPADQFDAPYFTFRAAPGYMWGEQMQDCRIALLGLNWRAADFIRGQFALQGGLPGVLATTGWDAAEKVDKGPQFLAPTTTIELPTGTAVKVLTGAVVFGLDIPLDEQWITGSYSPDAFDINSRQVSVSLGVKLTDDDLYKRINYDPAAGNAWAASIFKEARIKMLFNSDTLAGDVPYSLEVEANGSAGADANVAWSATPVGMRSGRQIVMNVTGTFLASPTAAQPVTVTLINQTTQRYGTYAV